MWYRICPDCGANLDPGEKCDCKEKKYEEEQTKGTDTSGKAADDKEQAGLAYMAC